MDTKFESFRPRLESIVGSGGIKTFVRDRILNGAGPELDCRFDDEVPESLLLYFAGYFENNGKVYRDELLGAARELLTEVVHEIPSGTFDYVSGLGLLLEKGRDKQSCPIALDLLVSKGSTSVATPAYFTLDGEARLLNVFGANYDISLPDDKKTQAKTLLLGYINGNFHNDLVQNAFYALFTIDRAEVKVLPTVFSKTNCQDFGPVAWSMVVSRTETEAYQLAHELVTLKPQNIDYFMNALRFSSSGFRDERTARFRDEVSEARKLPSSPNP